MATPSSAAAATTGFRAPGRRHPDRRIGQRPRGGPGLGAAIFAGAFADFRITTAGPRVQVQDRVGTEGNSTLRDVDILQFVNGFVNLATDTFTEGYAGERVEALMTTPGFSTDPAPGFAPTPSAAQVETLVTQSDTITS